MEETWTGSVHGTAVDLSVTQHVRVDASAELTL
jgi:hypothetical protein